MPEQYKSPERGKPTRLQQTLEQHYALEPTIATQGSYDTRALAEVLRRSKGKYFFFSDTLDTPVRPFNDILARVNALPVQRDQPNRLAIEYPDVDFNGHPSKLVALAYLLHEGRSDKPTIIQIPGFGSKPQRLNPLLVGQFPDFTQVGMEVFHGFTDAVKVANHIQNVQAAFALSTRMLRETIHVNHLAGRIVFVLGTSFGGKTISSHLNELARSDNTDPLNIADGYLPVEGGLFVPTFTGKHYTDLMVNPEMIQHKAFQEGYGFPIQSHLPKDLAERVGAVVNIADNVALGQEQCWEGTQMYKVQGTHFSGVTKNIFGIRGFIHDFIDEKVT